MVKLRCGGGLGYPPLEFKMAAWLVARNVHFASSRASLVSSEKVTVNLNSPSLDCFPRILLYLYASLTWGSMHALRGEYVAMRPPHMCIRCSVGLAWTQEIGGQLFQTWRIYKYCICNFRVFNIFDHYIWGFSRLWYCSLNIEVYLSKYFYIVLLKLRNVAL